MKNIQQELVDSANQIREKYRALKRGKFLEAEERFQTFQPLIEPLQELKKITSERPRMEILPMTPSRISMIPRLQQPQQPHTPQKLDFGLLASDYLGNYLSRSSMTDTTYGIRREANKFFIGNKEVEIASDDITVANKTYKGTKGLWQLLTLKEPEDYTPVDLQNYKEILEATNGHLKSYKDGAPMSSNRHTKYLNIIKPLFKSVGEGLRQVTGNKIDYIYWDDPNELVDRLRLLWLSRQAGNSGVDNEIDSIIEELRESGIIY